MHLFPFNLSFQDKKIFILLYRNYDFIVKQAKGLGIMNQAQKDSHVDNNYNFAINSLQLYATVTMTKSI